MIDEEKLVAILQMKRVLVSSDVYTALQALPIVRERLAGVRIEECQHLMPNTIMGVDAVGFVRVEL